MIMSNKKIISIIGFASAFLILIAAIGWLVASKPQQQVPESSHVTPVVKDISPTELKQVKAVTASDDLSDMIFYAKKKLYYISSFDENKIYALASQSNGIEGEIPLDAPNRLLLDLATDRLFVSGINGVSEVNLTNFNVVKSVGVGIRPSEMEIAHSGKYLFVTNEFSNDVSVIDLGSMKVMSTIPVGKRPVDIAKGQNDEFVYVVNKEDASVSKISIANLSVVSTIDNVGRPVVIEAYPGKDLMLILDQYGDNVIVVDTNTDKIVKTIRTVDYPAAIAFDTSNNRFFVSSFTKSSIGVIDTEKEAMVSELQLGTAFQPISGLNNMIYNAKDKSLIVTNTNTGKVFFVPVN